MYKTKVAPLAGGSIKFISVCTATVIFVLYFFMPVFSVYAFNKDYIDNVNYWYNKGTVITIDDYSFAKYVADSESGCFYTYIYIYDENLKNTQSENICLTFTVENSKNKYVFTVDKSGFADSSQTSATENIYLYSNLDKVSSTACGGEFFVGFSLLNNEDLCRKNYISCRLASGQATTKIIFSNLVLDLEPDETTTTTKNTTTKAAATSKSATTKSSNTTTGSKTSDTSQSGSTKFVPSTTKSDSTSSSSAAGSGSVNSKSNSSQSSGSNTTQSSKFSPSESGGSTEISDSDNYEQSAEEYVASDDENGYLSGGYGSISTQKSSLSKQAIACLIVASITLLAGIIIIIIAIVKKQKSDKETLPVDNTEQSENPDETDKSENSDETKDNTND